MSSTLHDRRRRRDEHHRPQRRKKNKAAAKELTCATSCSGDDKGKWTAAARVRSPTPGGGVRWDGREAAIGEGFCRVSAGAGRADDRVGRQMVETPRILGQRGSNEWRGGSGEENCCYWAWVRLGRGLVASWAERGKEGTACRRIGSKVLENSNNCFKHFHFSFTQQNLNYKV